MSTPKTQYAVIAVDSGKYATKALIRDPNNKEGFKHIIFRTKMDRTEEDASSDRTSTVIKFEGDKYILGEMAETVDYEKNKAKELHKIAIYTAIARLLPENIEHVRLACGCPLSVFENVNERKKYEKYFSSDKKIVLSLNGKEKSFYIDNVIVCPESCGIIYRKLNEYKDKIIGVIDIGGLNTNCCVYNHLVPIKSTMITTNLGGNIMTNNLKQEINSAFPEANIQDWQMEDIIKNGYIKNRKEESSMLIEKFFNKHVNLILNECKRKGWDLNNIDLVFNGGGSKLLEREINKNTSSGTVISDNAQFDNVMGFLTVGELNE